MFAKLYYTFTRVGIHLVAEFIFLNKIVAFGSFIVKEYNAFDFFNSVTGSIID